MHTVHKFSLIKYSDLNARQKENYNYQKVAAFLADYGFVSMRLSDDWQGADFISQHINGKTLLRVQLKGRMCIDKKYIGKDLYICFCEKDSWYLVHHDEFHDWAKTNTSIFSTHSWKVNGNYSVPYLPIKIKNFVAQYKI